MAASDTITGKLSSKCQITVPIEVRHRLGIKGGDRIEFAIVGDNTVIRPAGDEENSFAQFVGALPYFKSVAEINAWIAEMRNGDEGPEE